MVKIERVKVERLKSKKEYNYSYKITHNKK